MTNIKWMAATFVTYSIYMKYSPTPGFLPYGGVLSNILADSVLSKFSEYIKIFAFCRPHCDAIQMFVICLLNTL